MNTHTKQWKSRLVWMSAIALGGFTGGSALAQSDYTAMHPAAAFAVDSQQGSGAQSSTQSTEGGDKVTVPLSDPSRPGTLKVGLLYGSITVKGYEGKEVLVEAHARTRGGRRGWDGDEAPLEKLTGRRKGDDGAEENTQGMKRLAVNSTGLTVEEESNTIRVGTESMNRAVDLTISVPRQTSLVLRSTNDGAITVSDVNGDIDVNNTNGPVMMDHVSGSVLAHALNGRIHVTFDRVSAKPMAFSSLNGAIDVTFPPDLKANFTIRNDRGDVFSDFDVQLTAGQNQVVQDDRKDGGVYRVKIDRTIHANVGGGGPEIQFTNMNGNIYIRKTGAASTSAKDE